MVVDGHDALVPDRWVVVQVVWQDDGWTNLRSWLVLESSSRHNLEEKTLFCRVNRSKGVMAFARSNNAERVGDTSIDKSI